MMTAEPAPKVSVLMPVHNAGPFLDEALTSLAKQTWSGFEVVAVDDASDDDGPGLLRERARSSPWLRVVTRREKSGVAAALNTGLEVCRGELIARMDADDVASSERLSRQVEYLSRHPGVGLCGGQARIFGGGREEVVKPPETDEAIRAWLVFGSAFVHPTVMFRREALEKAGGRYAAVVGVEDYDLWLRMAEVTRMANLPEELLRYRMHAAQYTATKSDRHFQELDRLRLAWLAGKGLRLDEEEAMAHRALVFDRRPDESPRPWRVAAWLRRLLEELPAAGWCGRAALREMVAERWWAWMLQRGRGGPGAALAYAAGPVGGLGGRELRRGARLLLGRLAPGGGRPGRGT